jgi:hypothetical protein
VQPLQGVAERAVPRRIVRMNGVSL